MMKIAVIITVFNRIEKTLTCLDSLFDVEIPNNEFDFKVFLTDDGSTDNTTERIKQKYPSKNIQILEGNGQLFWNGGMNNSWNAAISEGSFNGYLWLNNDCIVFSNLWKEIIAADLYSIKNFAKGGIYVGSTYNKDKTELSYGGFNFINKWTLKDKFFVPNGNFQNCQAAHGNITYVSDEVVKKEGVLFKKYKHGGGDHDYTYTVSKHGFPVFILREYVGMCENDHFKSSLDIFLDMTLKERLSFLKSPLGFNLDNTLLFQARHFPFRYPLVLMSGYGKVLFPKLFFKLYRKLRS